MENLDLVVIGAGTYGLGAAKQYRSQHLEDSIAILDSASTLGGTWAKHRLYPSLKTNNLTGTYEFPDFPMDHETFGVQPGKHVSGESLHQYLIAYTKEFNIHDLIRFNTKVLSAEHNPEGGWLLRIQYTTGDDSVDGTILEIFARRLIMATGKTSQPFMPHIDGQDSFGKPLFHAKDFVKHADTINPKNKITIFGGTKFAWDAVYAYAIKGVQVDWVIRETGHGTCWMSPPYVTPLKAWLEKLVNTRVVHWFSPCIWGADSGFEGIKSFWHGTAVGRAIVNTFWSILAGDVIQLMNYNQHPEIKKLTPTSDAFSTGCSFSIMNYDTDFFELIRNGTVKVHLADLSHLSPGKVHLEDAQKKVLDSDGLMCVTGWEHMSAIKFLPEGIDQRIGLSYNPSKESASNGSLAGQQSLLERADKEIQDRFPQLKIPGKFNPSYVPLTETKGFSVQEGNLGAPTLPHTAMMLYHLMVPGTPEFLRTKDLAFAGSIMNFSNVLSSHLQGLWISAYFDGKLVRDPSTAVMSSPLEKLNSPGLTEHRTIMTLEQVQYETVLHNRFGKWRYPNDPGAISPDFVFEAVPYLDMLLADLGLKVHRKGGWFKEIFSAYGPEDFRDVNEEWQRKFG